ncbi:MAG: response regulator, partial [Rhodoferax sp.]
GMTDLVLNTPLSAQQREYLSTVKDSGEALLSVINDILDFSKIEAGKLQIEALRFSLAEVLGGAVQAMSARAELKGLALQCQWAPDLPQWVCGDPGRLRQIVLNLCDNAIKFTASGAVTVQAKVVSMGEHGHELQVAVRDTGFGIAPDKQHSVFQAFSQADTSTTRQSGGTGLGLARCARLVALMGGRMWIESVLGQGSCFYFTLQVGKCDAPDESSAAVAPSAALPDPVRSATARPGLQVLLVEDHPINQKLATSLLQRWGHSVVLAQNGQEAVDLFGRQAWDLVLMDMQMPVMDGIEATGRIRAMEGAGQRVPIVAMTANAMEADRQACLAAGMDEHLVKPFDAAGLRAMVERMTQVPA